MTLAIKDLDQLIAQLTPKLHEQAYVYTCLPITQLAELSKLAPFALVLEKEGLTGILDKASADKYALTYQGEFACITLEVHSSLDAVGLTAAVSTALAEQDISANVIAAYHHDHVLVNYQDGEKALALLQRLSEKYQA